MVDELWREVALEEIESCRDEAQRSILLAFYETICLKTSERLVEVGYTPDQERVARYFSESFGVGGGVDPVGFLIVSHAEIGRRLKALT